MKNFIFISMMLGFTFALWAQQKSPVEGTWKLAGVTSKSGTAVRNWKSEEFGEEVKTWTGDHFSFKGKMKDCNSDVDLFGHGTYALNGKVYVEAIAFHNDISELNTKCTSTLEFRNDTLYHVMQNLDPFCKEAESCYVTKKYVKLDK